MQLVWRPLTLHLRAEMGTPTRTSGYFAVHQIATPMPAPAAKKDPSQKTTQEPPTV